jgi:hypothetical protein
MCANCVTAVEATAIQTVGAALIAQQGWHRVRDAMRRRPPTRRAQLVYDRNCEFVESLGLDAASVLGARPSTPAPSPHGAPSHTLPALPPVLIGSADVNG